MSIAMNPRSQTVLQLTTTFVLVKWMGSIKWQVTAETFTNVPGGSLYERVALKGFCSIRRKKNVTGRQMYNAE